MGKHQKKQRKSFIYLRFITPELHELQGKPTSVLDLPIFPFLFSSFVLGGLAWSALEVICEPRNHVNSSGQAFFSHVKLFVGAYPVCRWICSRSSTSVGISQSNVGSVLFEAASQIFQHSTVVETDTQKLLAFEKENSGIPVVVEMPLISTPRGVANFYYFVVAEVETFLTFGLFFYII